MPFLQAFPAAGCRGMLGNKNRMIPHGGLAAVVYGKSRGQTPADKIKGMLPDGRKSFIGGIMPLFACQPEPGPERGASEFFQDIDYRIIHEPGHVRYCL